MKDAFDMIAAPAQKQKPKGNGKAYQRPEPPPPMTPSQLARAIRKLVTGQWCVFEHPTHGKVAGQCVGVSPSGYSEPGHIPDFAITIQGRSRMQRNEVTVSMVESRAMFFDTEGEALAELLTQK
jgi:hypothetical protein